MIAPLVTIVLLATRPGLPATGLPADSPPLVSVSWVAERLTDPRLVLFQIGPREDYDAGHVPGSRFVDPFTDLAAPRGGPLRLELPTMEALQAVLRAKGVNDDSYIVLAFSSEWLTPTGRAFMTLEYAGLRGRVSILDGGFAAWKQAGKPTSVAEASRPAGTITLHPDPAVVVSADWLTGRLRDPTVTVIDARTPEFYNDERDNSMPRGGHIPGARNIPFNSLSVEGGALKDIADIRKVFAEAGATERVVTYCHIGQQASWVYFVARVVGLDVSLYDGSFEEWSANKSLPVEGERRNPARP